MQLPKIEEIFTGSVNRVRLGATKDNGGTRNSTVTVGGARNVVYGGSVEQMSEKPLISDNYSYRSAKIRITGMD